MGPYLKELKLEILKILYKNVVRIKASKLQILSKQNWQETYLVAFQNILMCEFEVMVVFGNLVECKLVNFKIIISISQRILAYYSRNSSKW